MPQVPYQPYPTEKPTEGGPGPLRVDTPGAAFGENIGHAIGALGKSVEHAGDELFRRAIALQQLQNETDATNAKTEFMTQAGMLREQFGTLEGGRNAAAALPKLEKDLKETRMGVRAGLKTDAARKMYDGESLGVMGRVIFAGAGHAANQTKQANDQALDASLNLKLTELYNQGYYPGWEGEIKDLMQRKGAIKGWDPDTEAKNFDAMISTAKSHYITGLAQREPMKAQEEYDKVKGTLRPDDDIKVQHTLTTAIRTTASRFYAQKEIDSKSEDPVEVRRERAVKASEEAHPEDPQMGWYTGNAFDRLNNAQHAHEVAQKREAIGTVSMAMKANPTSPEALTADPKTKAAWDKLNWKEQKPFLEGMKQIAKGDVWQTEETEARYFELKGMSRSKSAEELGQFLDICIPCEKIPLRQRHELIDLQQRVRVDPKDDVRLTRAFQVLNAPLLKSTVFKEDPGHKKYNQWVGLLYNAIDIHQQQTGKSPTNDEIKVIGTNLLTNTEVAGAWYGKSQVPVYQFGAKSPAIAVEKRIRDYKAQTGKDISNIQARQLLAAEEYKRLFGSTGVATSGE